MRRALKAVVCLGLSLSLGFSTVAFGAEKKETKSSIEVQAQKKAEKASLNVSIKSRQARKYVNNNSGKAKVCFTNSDIENADIYTHPFRRNCTSGNF